MKYFFYAAGAVILLILTLTAINFVTKPAALANKTFQTDNIIFNYERFYDVSAAYDSRTAQITQFKSDLAAATNPDEQGRIKMELGAVQQTCRDLATQYNADSQKINREIFKSNDLPERLDLVACN